MFAKNFKIIYYIVETFYKCDAQIHKIFCKYYAQIRKIFNEENVKLHTSFACRLKVMKMIK